MPDLAERLQSGLAERYRLGPEVGRGGMAQVFVADDLKHGRRVAVKALDPQLEGTGAERFLREIDIVARLTHPHILPLYDSGRVGELLYFVMPLVSGESLRSKLDRERRLDIGEALQIVRQIAGALDYAHRCGVVHRDVKPANILLHEGAAVIADFGIATALASAAGESLTRTGFVVGTPEHMSPEQVAGDAPVDARSDVYALGSVLYAMLSGEPPFAGPTVAAVMARKLTDTAPSLRSVRSEVPETVSSAVARALARNPDDRFPSTTAFAAALQETSGSRSSAERSIVVLPFANLSPDPQNEYFADGLTDELIGDLSKLRGMRVICRTSAMAWKGTAKDARAIATDLDVQYVVEGSVRRAGDRLRVTAQLVSASTNATLWSDRYDGVLHDVFEIQERLARTIVDALKMRLTPEEDARLAARPIQNVHAHESYLRARQQLWRWRRDAINEATRILTDALATVGDNALLHATLGLAHAQSREAGIDLTGAAVAAAEEAASKAQALDPALPAVLLLQAWIHIARGRTAEAVRDLRITLEADPNNPDALAFLSNCYLISGRVGRAQRIIARYSAVDPLNPVTRALVGYAAVVEGRHADAVTAYGAMLDMDPESPLARLFYGWSLIQAGRRDDAVAILGGFGPDVQGPIGARLGLCMRAALQGAVHDDLARLDEEFSQVDMIPDMFARFLGWCYALLGDLDRTLFWLRVAADRGFINYPFLAVHDELAARIRPHPEFQAFLADVRDRWERFDG